MFDLHFVYPRGGTVRICHGLRTQYIDLVCGYNAADIGEKPFSIAACYLEPDRKCVVLAELQAHFNLALLVVRMDVGTVFDMDRKTSSARDKTDYIVAWDRVAALCEPDDKAVDAFYLDSIITPLLE